MKKNILFFCAIAFSLTLYSQVHTSYLWHLHQPVYWSEQSQWTAPQYQDVWESHYLKTNGGNIYSDGKAHPLNDLEEIFSKDDRRAVYQYRAKDAVQTLLGFPEAGAQVNYSGALIENINSLAAAGQWGYNPGWQNNYITARNWQTNGGNPRMDIVGFTYHHITSPLVSENVLRKDIQAYRYIYQQTFGTQPGFSKGYWPAECSFSERIIKVLVQEGFEWSVIANSHLARTLADYPLSFGTSVCNIDPPNGADKVSTVGTNWWSGQIDGRGGTFAAPYCYQAHKAQYVDPSTGQIFKLTVVPMDDVLSYMNGYALMGTDEIDSHIAPFENPQHPGIVLLAHDGDNAWGGGYDYYQNSVPQFAQACASKGYVPSTVQQFLDSHPVPESDVVHVEDGSWVNAANDWGHPQFINWLWPMYTNDFEFHPEGWTEDVRNWAVLTAAENRVQMAEDLTGPINIADVVSPTATSPLAAKAWHHLLPGFASDFMYYGTALDMEVKQTLAANLAVGFADQVISANAGTDDTPPSVFIPQRYPYNPGGTGFGPNYGYQQHQNPSDFFVWTFAYDVAGLQNVTLKYRVDEDGANPLITNENETYIGGTGVGSWQNVTMTSRIFPTGNITNNPEIDFFMLPTYIATEYYGQITGLSEKLVDYYIEAVDNHGNITKTAIQHVYVGTDTPGGSGTGSVSWIPEDPGTNDVITIIIEDATQGAKLHWGVNGFNPPNEAYWPEGTYLVNGTGPAVETPFIGPNSQNQLVLQIGPFNNPTQAVTNVSFVIHYNDDSWDNNNGNDFIINLGPGGTDIIQWQPASPGSNETITITVNQAAVGGKLHWGVNGWTNPNQAYWPAGSFLFNGTGPAVQSPMTGPNSGNQLTIQIGPFNNPQQEVNTIDFVINFNDGSWNNNNGQDYHITISPAASNGGLTGLVSSQLAGNIISGAIISVTDGTNTYTGTSSDLISPGINYSIPEIIPGIYNLSCTATGYFPIQMNDVIILNNNDLTVLNIEMEPLSFPPPPGWEVTITPDTHIISIPPDLSPTINGTPLKRGDYLGVFYQDENRGEKCGGLVEWRNEATVLIAFADDAFTATKDGFADGENFIWKVFSQQDQLDYPADATYNTLMPNFDGKFHSNGLSQLLSLEAFSLITQNITIYAGWSGISLFVDPFTKPVEDIFAPFGDDFIILMNPTGFYYPASNTNTLGNWDYLSGYQIKNAQDINLTIAGSPIADPSVDLQAGWNLIPVLTSCGGQIYQIFDGFSGLNIIKEIAGTNIYWPAYGIATLNYLEPGKSYWVSVNTNGSFTYPDCSANSYIPGPQEIPVNETPWNDVSYSAVTHTLALPSAVIHAGNIRAGDYIGAFTSSGRCAGMVEINNINANIAITVFGNDEFTAESDGFENDETLQFKLFRSEGSLEINLDVEFESQMPQQGNFASNGISSFKDITFNQNSLPQLNKIVSEIYPNPSNGQFMLTLNHHLVILQIQVIDLQGRVLMDFTPEINEVSGNIELKLNDLMDGIYFLKLNDSNFTEMKKIIIR